jgi:hypothetical protein
MKDTLGIRIIFNSILTAILSEMHKAAVCWIFMNFLCIYFPVTLKKGEVNVAGTFRLFYPGSKRAWDKV